ncbi:MAG: hypothetical protein LBC41_13765, partial [Clostridiales bacterium]|nr:hypothetical protein [Clostridiales bacterium]
MLLKKIWLILGAALFLALPATAKAEEVTVYAEYALIDGGMALEETDSIWNIGGWTSGYEAIFFVDYVEEGYYDIILDYAKQDDSGPVDMAMRIESDGYDEETIEFSLAPTGSDWSVYEYESVGSAFFPEGGATLTFGAADPLGDEYLCNLRSVTLSPVIDDLAG